MAFGAAFSEGDGTRVGFRYSLFYSIRVVELGVVQFMSGTRLEVWLNRRSRDDSNASL